MKILYVEDNLQDVDLTRRRLARLAPHMQVDAAAALDEARRRLQEPVEYDLVLLDLRLPDGSGLDLLREIQEQALPVAVVILTGSGDEGTAVAALKAGAHDYIVKRADYLERLPGILETAVARFRRESAHRPRILRVMYVEHHSTDIDLTRRHLGRYAPYIRLEILHSIEEALQRLPQSPQEACQYDILLLDYQMPGLNALDALKIVREERRLDLPVVLVTGQGNEEVAAQALRLGASDYLIKHTRYLFELPAVLENAYHSQQAVREQVALFESEARFRRLAENAQDIIFRIRIHPDAQIEYISPAITTLTGYFAEDFYNIPNFSTQIIVDEDLAQLITVIPDKIDDESLITLRLKHKEGHLVWVEINPVLVKDRNGRVVALEGIARDITAGKKAQDELRLQGAALEAAANGILITDINGSIQWVNPALEALTGYSADELIGQNPRILKSEKHTKAFYTEMWNTVLAGKVWHGEIINCRKDGSLYTEEMTITPFSDTKGGISHFIAIKHDVTPRKAAEADRARLLSQIREQAQRVQQIIETVPEGVLLLDGNGQVVLANPAAQRDLAFLAKLDQHGTILSLGERPLAELLTTMARGQWHEFEVENHIFETIAQPVGEDVPPEHWVLVINDVTEERAQSRYLQIQERLATVGQLAAGIAHDFNNVMAVIVLYAQLLQKATGLSQKNRQYLSMVESQAQHAARLIEQILDFSRRSPMELLPLNLLLLIKELVKLLERTLPENIELSFEFEQRDFVIRADPTRLQQALMNLAFNGRDAMPDGGKLSFHLSRLSISADETPPLPDMAAGNWVRLDVADTGMGIAPEYFPHLFEPFFTSKKPGKGTGLGLAQVHGIVKQHGGSIDVKSQLGGGAVFTIYLPCLALPLIESTTPQTNENILVGTETVLLVEDNEALRLSVKDALTGLGYLVLAAGNGKEALEILEVETAVSLLLTDLVMPEMGGLMLGHQVHEQYPHVKTLLMTGYPLGQDKDVLQEEGIADWIIKPFSVEALAGKMRQILDKPDGPADAGE